MTHKNNIALPEQENNFKKIVEQVIADYHLPLKSEELNTWRNSDNKKLVKWVEDLWLVKAYTVEAKDLEEQVPHWWDDLMEEMKRGEKMDRVEEIIKHWKDKAERAEQENKELKTEIETHLEAMEVAGKERWTQKEASAKDIKEKNKKLKSASEKVSYLESRVEKLEEESSQKSKKIEKLSKQLVDSESQNENLKWLDHLNSKPLPALPIEEENKILTKQSIFKRLKTKAKVKIQKLQSLIKKEKFHNQEIIARVEVSSK